MNKFWLAFFIILLLAVILTVGLTVTFLYKGKKDDKDAKHHEIIWTFHLDNEESNLKGTLEDIINVDILKTMDYEVGGNKATPRSLHGELGDLTVTGWMHVFKYPLRVTKVVVGKAEIKVGKVVPISGFAVIDKEGNADFVTLWHDDAFHHYSTSGEHLATGAFPFAKGDESKHPDMLDLPKEVSDADLAHPKLPEDVPLPHEDEEVPKVVPEDKDVPIEHFHPEEVTTDKTALKAGALVVDLDLASQSQVGAPLTYKDGEDEITITRATFNVNFEKWTFTLTNPRPVVPYIKYEGTMVDVGCSDIMEVAVFVGKYNLPLLANFKERVKFRSFAHNGNNEWQSVRATVVDVETLDGIYCFLKEMVIFDFSKQSGKYTVGGFEVHVSEMVGSEPFERFKSFKHTIHKRTATTLEPASAKVHKYKFFKVNFNGLNPDDEVTSATAFFWDGDLTKALMLRLLVGDTFKNYVGYKDFKLEPKASALQGRLERLNYQVNRALTINLAKTAPYDFKGGLLGTREEHVAIKVEDDTPLKKFKKFVHTHAGSRNMEHFKILGFVGEEYLKFEQKDVSLVETYFLKGHMEKPLLFSLKGHFHTHHYFLEDGKFVKKELIFGDLAYTLKHLAYHTFTYLTLNLKKFSSYHFSGESVFPKHRHSHVVVRRNDESEEFVRTTHTLEKVHGELTDFFVLALEGADIDLKDQVVTSVDAYFVKGHFDEPIAVNFKGAAQRLYVATTKGYEQKESILLSNSKKLLRRAAFDKLKLVYLQLHRMSNYYDEHLDGLEVTVEKRTDDLEIDGFNKFVHTFPETTDVRFLIAESYFDPKVDPMYNLNKAVVITGRKDFPVLVSLIDIEGNSFYFKYVGDNEWTKVKPMEMNRFLLEINQKLAEEEVPAESRPPKMLMTGLYPY
ncbi:hypothetical protein MACK_003688 [Theileria orientalis]|uniref:Uncharacterized protein n=1 Tax=Theileria orientalis TaxID=68886 RepID=A0A976SJJ3_THEOR|nr:hypothetical protein MACK_003688 [Theileria orientalis]